jgi:hypothetical protein
LRNKKAKPLRKMVAKTIGIYEWRNCARYWRIRIERVVVNAMPLITLFRIQQVYLLPHLFLDIVVTGVSGSGKSSLSFGTLNAEGRQRDMSNCAITQADPSLGGGLDKQIRPFSLPANVVNLPARTVTPGGD